MSGKLNLALAVIAMQHGNKADCLSYMAKAAEFGDDLTDFVSEIIKPPPRAARNASVPAAENTLSPSLASSNADFVTLGNRVSRVMAIAASLDYGDEMDAEQADEAFDDDLELDTGIDGVDEDDEDEDEEDMEAVASVGPIRYKV